MSLANTPSGMALPMPMAIGVFTRLMTFTEDCWRRRYRKRSRNHAICSRVMTATGDCWYWYYKNHRNGTCNLTAGLGNRSQPTGACRLMLAKDDLRTPPSTGHKHCKASSLAEWPITIPPQVSMLWAQSIANVLRTLIEICVNIREL